MTEEVTLDWDQAVKVANTIVTVSSEEQWLTVTITDKGDVSFND